MYLKNHENRFHVRHFCFIWEKRFINYVRAYDHVARNHVKLLNNGYNGSFIAKDLTDSKLYKKHYLKPEDEPINPNWKDYE